jgi:hypothetical protein
VTARDQKTNYLVEHLPYMLKMVRHSHLRMHDSRIHYLDRNAFIESFTANARTLIQFLSNDDKANIKAADFIEGFRSEIDEVTRRFIQLSRHQTFHLGKNRPTETRGKINISDSPAIKNWIEKEFDKLVACLSQQDRKLWDAHLADPTKEVVRPAYEGSIQVNAKGIARRL